MTILVVVSTLLLLTATYALARSRRRNGVIHGHGADETSEVTLYQKVDEVVRALTSANVVGTGSSGVVYRGALLNGDSLAVKKMWSSDEAVLRQKTASRGNRAGEGSARLMSRVKLRGTDSIFPSV